MSRIAEYINGQMVYRDMTAEEEQEFLDQQANAPAYEPTPEERIAQLEQQLAAAKILLGVDE